MREKIPKLEICLVYANFVKHVSLSMLIGFMLLKKVYHISKTMKHIFLCILKPHKNRKILFLMLCFMIYSVDYALYYK